MYDKLVKLSRNFLSVKQSPYKRYLLQRNPFTNQLSLIVGQRGVGKTTALVQLLLDRAEGDLLSNKILYIQSDHFQVGNLALYEIAEKFVTLGGKWLALDEIHKYPKWSSELKSIYDTFPQLSVFASGSSALELYKGSHDLSRRAIQHLMHGMSFREYLGLKFGLHFPSLTIDEIVKDHERIVEPIIKAVEERTYKILPLFQKYLMTGYYPFFHELHDERLFTMALEQNMHATIESDIPAIYPQLSGTSLLKMKKLLVFIAQTVPFTPNWKKILSALEVGDERTLKTYFHYLEDGGLIRTVGKATHKFSRLETPEKVYLNNSNQLFALSTSDTIQKGTVRETFFLSMASVAHEVTVPVKGDFVVDSRFLFEIGGKNKTSHQIGSAENGSIVCDDTERGIGRKIPLWLFGFLY